MKENNNIIIDYKNLNKIKSELLNLANSFLNETKKVMDSTTSKKEIDSAMLVFDNEIFRIIEDMNIVLDSLFEYDKSADDYLENSMIIEKFDIETLRLRISSLFDYIIEEIKIQFSNFSSERKNSSLEMVAKYAKHLILKLEALIDSILFGVDRKINNDVFNIDILNRTESENNLIGIKSNVFSVSNPVKKMIK